MTVSVIIRERDSVKNKQLDIESRGYEAKSYRSVRIVENCDPFLGLDRLITFVVGQ
jgi:hypothetical protein